MNFQKGDRVSITAKGIGGKTRTVEGKVILASENGVSLCLQFEAILNGHAGTMPILKTDHGYVTLFGDPVDLQKLGVSRPK